MDNMIIFRCGYMIIIIHWINKDFFSYLLQQIINQSVITSWEEDQVLFINLFGLIQHIFFILQDLCILWEKFILKIQIVPKLSYSRFVLQYPTYWFCFANIKHYFYLNTNSSLWCFDTNLRIKSRNRALRKIGSKFWWFCYFCYFFRTLCINALNSVKSPQLCAYFV